MQQGFNPYAAMSAEDLQGLAQQQSLENIKRQQDFIGQRKGDISYLAQLPQAQGNNFVMPLAGITDAWTGSNLSRQAQQLAGNDPAAERLAMIQKIENSISNSEGVLNKSTDNLMDAALREKLAKQQNDLLERKIAASGDDSPMKEFEFQAARLGKRAEASNSSLEEVYAKGYTPKSDASSKVDSMLATFGIDNRNDDQKSVAQAETNFLSAILRKESGAQISPPEFAMGEKTYFERKNDSPAVKAQKAQARKIALQGLKAEAGKAWTKSGFDLPIPSDVPKTDAPASGVLSFEDWKAQKKGKKP